MKKLTVLFLVVSLLIPSSAFSKLYKRKRLIDIEMPTRTPIPSQISVFVNETTGNLLIFPSNDITGLNITLTGYGVTYINTTVSLTAGHGYTDCLDYLAVGTYLLTLSTADGMIDLYEITVKPD